MVVLYMAPRLKKRSPQGRRASGWDSNCSMKALFSPHIAKTSDQHLLVQRFAPMQNFDALAQPTSPEGVGLQQLMNTFFGLGLHDPQGTFGHLPKLLAQTARHAHLRLMYRPDAKPPSQCGLANGRHAMHLDRVGR